MKGEKDSEATTSELVSPKSQLDNTPHKNTSEHKENFVVIGRVTGVHGVRGHIKIQSFTNPLNALLEYKSLYWDYNRTWQPIPIVKNSIKSIGDFIILNIIDCVDRDEARKYQFSKIAVLRSALPSLEADQYYWSDLEGLEVYTTQDATSLLYLGKVDHLLETGSNDVLVVRSGLSVSDEQNKANKNNKSSQPKEYLIPYIMGLYIVRVDLELSRIIVDWDPEF